MKRIVLIGIAVTLISALACRKPAEVVETPSLPTNEPAVSEAPSSTATDIPITAEPTAVPTAIHTPYGAPPRHPIFYSAEEYLRLSAAIDLDDAECEEFLLNHFIDDGIFRKADAIKTLEIINSMPFPVADRLELISVELAYHHDSFDILYGIEGEEDGYLSFDIALTGSDAETDRKELEQKYSLVELPETRTPELKFLARLGEAATGDPNFPFIVRWLLTNIRSHTIEIQTNLSEKELVDILANCEFTTMDEYAKKAKP